jgi:tRNA dimethylallyltransferase
VTSGLGSERHRRRLAIVGPTASGKSRLALDLAERVEGVEIVSVDSMQVYRGMDIGTAKPTGAERAAVRHHLIDLLDPHEECSVAWFRDQASGVLADLETRGVPAVLVGGTGLYHRVVVDGLEVPGQWPDVRAALESEPDTVALHRRLAELDPLAASRMDPSNRRRVVRALEVTLGAGRPFSSFGPGLDAYPPATVVLVGLSVERAVLAERIERRFRRQLDDGFLDEVRRLDARPEGWSRTAAQALGYRELLPHARGLADLDACVADAIAHTRRFAVRQERWFRRDPRIEWFDADRPDLVDAVVTRWRAG